MAQDVEQLARVFLARAERRLRRGLCLEQPVAEHQVRLGALRGAPIGLDPAGKVRGAEGGPDREPDEDRDVRHEPRVDLVEPEPERLHAADGEEDREHERDRQQPAQEHRAGLVAEGEVDGDGLVRRGRDAGREEQEPERHVQRDAAAGHESVQLRDPAEMTRDGEHRDDHRGHEQRAVPAPGAGRGRRREQEQQAEQQETDTAERRGPTREDRDELRHLVGEQHRIDPQVDPEEVLDEEQHREHGGEQRGGLSQALGADLEREQGRAGEHEQDGVERLGKRKEQRGRDQGHCREHVGLQQAYAERHRDGTGHDRDSADS